MDKINVQESLFCPVTGLPVKRSDHWQRQRLGADYTVNYSLLGQSVLYSAPIGSVSLKEMRAGIALTDKVARQRPHPTRPFVMIYDLHALNSVTLKARRYFIQHYIETPQLLALVFCNVSPLLKIGIKLGQRINTTNRKTYIADDYAQAAVMAIELCKKHNLTIGPYTLGSQIIYNPHCSTLTPVELRSSNAWQIQSGDYANKSVVMNQSILFSKSQGYLRSPDIRLIDRMRESVRATLAEGYNLEYIIVDSSNLEGGDRIARQRYMRSLMEWHSKYPVKLYILIGANAFMSTAALLARPIMKFRIEIARDLNHALSLIRKSRRQLIEGSKKPEVKVQPLNVTDKDVEKTLAYISGVNWEQQGLDMVVPMSEGHPLYSIVQAIKLIKLELDELFDERKLAETALKKSEEKYRDLFEKGSDWLCTHDLEGNLLETNFAFKTDAGFANRMSDPPNIKDLVPEHYRDEVDSYLERIRHNGFDHGIMSVETESGREIKLEYSTVLMSDVNGELTLVKGSARDITREIEAAKEKKRLENRLHHAQKMESIGTLAGGIAHDFNNILSSIIGFTELALEDAPDGTFLEDNLLEVRKAGVRAKDLVNQILTFARQSDEQKRPVQAGLIAKEVLKLIRSTIPANIHIIQRIESSAMVLGNPTQIHQIFMNLCTNAAHAMSEKGGILEVDIVDVDLTTEKIHAHPGLHAGPYLKITVSDNGIGIQQKSIDLIFEPYYTTKAPGRGTGMGLATVHGIVQAYGGEISVDSAPGSGSVFTILLPACKRPSTTNRRSDAQQPTGTERILFVDDESSIVKMADRMLRRLGYQVKTFVDSELALKHFRTSPVAYDLVVTDMTMPKLTGDILAKRVLEIRPDIPIVMWTGFSEKMTAARASRIGIKALHNKPVTKFELARTIRSTLDAGDQPVRCQRDMRTIEKIDD